MLKNTPESDKRCADLMILEAAIEVGNIECLDTECHHCPRPVEYMITVSKIMVCEECAIRYAEGIEE